MSLTTDPNDPNLKQTLHNGQQSTYLVLSKEERAKGFVRPVRRSYKHVGSGGPKNPLRDLTADEHARYDQYHYVKYEAYPEAHDNSAIGRFWTQTQLDARGCGTVTTMGEALCETYARDPKFYGSTFCCECGKHFPVREFTWVEDGAVVGS